MSLRDELLTFETTFSSKSARKIESLFESIALQDDDVQIIAPDQLRDSIRILPEIAAFGSVEAKMAAHRLSWNTAAACGIFPASIDALYRRIGRTEVTGITVPAMNMRAIAFESARGVFQAMRELDVGAAIFELSRGEIGFTAQRPHEYATAILCAAVAEGHKGPLFLQGDHFQVSASRYAQDPDAELGAVRALIAEAINAGFYNIDIDCSTLVDLSFSTEAEQQKINIDLTVDLARHARALEPAGVTISLGGEIGEVGDENSTVPEVEAYLGGVTAALGDTVPQLTKLSIQSGTRHGGNMLSDGSFGDMNVEFALINRLSAACRNGGGLAGCVQHGASMLPLVKIAQLPGADCIEVHLAAAFLNEIYDHLPDELVEKADSWAKNNFADEWVPDWSEAQFLHHARRYPIGPFKREWWNAQASHESIRNAVRDRAEAYFTALGVTDTKALVSESITHAPVAWQCPDSIPMPLFNEIEICDLAD